MQGQLVLAKHVHLDCALSYSFYKFDVSAKKRSLLKVWENSK